MSKKVELLAPAGNYECFKAAISAGADAVYLAGNRFGARAFADNFSNEELIRAIHEAHLVDRKIYMTVNTLLKDAELGELIAYLKPFYEEGLDAVIVQDIGAVSLIKKAFPDMEIHISTQMTITGPEGSSFAKQAGACRVVPARELSLEEIRRMKEADPEMELECFIHGALCYCYSGQCLFSSLLGGRSGNRGTCAQPCRLPYDVLDEQGQIQVKEKYPLSMKDLCTVSLIADLIEAGIDSFKIEGRMKSAEYVAGVTGIYRTVIDRYYENPKKFEGATKKEIQILRGLYVRSELEEGYYHRYHGKAMITPEKPSYIGTSEEVLAYVKEHFMNKEVTRALSMEAELSVGKPCRLTVRIGDEKIVCEGVIVDEAQKRAMTEEDIKKQLRKVGGSAFYVEELSVKLNGNVFIPVGSLNELRRQAIADLEEKLLLKRKYEESYEKGPVVKLDGMKQNAPRFLVSLRTMEQWKAVKKHLKGICRLIIEESLYKELKNDSDFEAFSGEVYLRVPRILRSKNRVILDKIRSCLQNEEKIAGLCVSTPDGYQAVKEFPKKRMGDAFLYCMNSKAYQFWKEKEVETTLSPELNEGEIRRLISKNDYEGIIQVYGHIPMMISANCVCLTAGKKGCVNQTGIYYLKDRKGVRFPVLHDCSQCNNIIYNSLPISLHKHLQSFINNYLTNWLLEFTVEDEKQTEEVLCGYLQDFSKMNEEKSISWKYTNGHYQRGVM